MKIFIPKEGDAHEPRVPMIPTDVEKLVKLGAEVTCETGMGAACHYPDERYAGAGAKVIHDRAAGFAEADLVLRLRKPTTAEVELLKPGTIHISYLDPFNSPELVKALAARGVKALCMEMIPRSTIAQKMDALSSQASLGGYVAVMLAANRLKRIFPMMMTPAGTIQPARVLIIGAGVAGLQAIATAKRLGARVEAFDTRPAVAEQVRSLGARFVEIDLGETGQTKEGYAQALSEVQLQRQREGMAHVCAQADVIITTAQVFGRRAPLIVTREMVAGMKPGSVIVDMAVESGGNVEGSIPGQEVMLNGVRIIGIENLPGQVAVDASQMYSANLFNLVSHFWDKERGGFKLDLDDEIIQAALVTAENEIRSTLLRNHYQSQ